MDLFEVVRVMRSQRPGAIPTEVCACSTYMSGINTEGGRALGLSPLEKVPPLKFNLIVNSL